jgi:hypothetical protein
MAKKFMYVCFGILGLAVAFHLGALYGNASIVDHSMTGIIASHREGNKVAVLLENDAVWSFNGDSWNLSNAQPPVAPGDIKFYHGIYLVTYDNELWYIASAGGDWVNYGSPPAGPTLNRVTTWGRIKAK